MCVRASLRKVAGFNLTLVTVDDLGKVVYPLFMGTHIVSPGGIEPIIAALWQNYRNSLYS